MTLPWFRFYAEFAGDPTIQSLAFEDQRHFVVLLCLKCEGVLDRAFANNSVRDRVIYRALGLDPVAASEAKRRLMEVALIGKDWQIPSWDRRQYISDSSTQRVRKYRKSKETGNVPETLRNRFGNAPDTDTEEDSSLRSESSIAVTSVTARHTTPREARRPPCPYAEIRALWIEVLPELRAPLDTEHWTPARKAAISARWRDQLPSLDSWRDCFARVRKSRFLMGRVNGNGSGKPFQADLFWIAKPENLLKLYEGKYDG